MRKKNIGLGRIMTVLKFSSNYIMTRAQIKTIKNKIEIYLTKLYLKRQIDRTLETILKLVYSSIEIGFLEIYIIIDACQEC